MTLRAVRCTVSEEAVGASGACAGRWYVVHTQPRCEQAVSERLQQQGFVTFCPFERRTVRHARRVYTKLAALFPNYLFVQLDMTLHQWRCVNGTRGAIRLIANGDVPTSIPSGMIEQLQKITDISGEVSWASTLKVGDQVRISDGPFSSFIGTLDRLDASGRVRVLLDLLGREVRIALSSKAISPAA